jgi:sugar phosphate isomerase/epimerase
MQQVSRRQFVGSSLTTAAALAFAKGFTMKADPLGLPMGFQIYGLRDAAGKDFPGTLKQTAAIGYRAVELCSFHGYDKQGFGPLADMKPADIRKVVQDSDLRCESCHFNSREWDDPVIDQTIEWANGVGLKFMILSMAKQKPVMSMDDWKQNFDLMNKYGERVKKAGMQFGYHTHGTEWKVIGGVMVFDELLRSVDPKLVQGQLDMAGIVTNGVDPADYMRKHPGRFCSLHVKDIKKGQTGMGSLPVGQGDIDWNAVFTAAKVGGIKNYSVEMEVKPPVDPMEALKVSAAYLHGLKV